MLLKPRIQFVGVITLLHHISFSSAIYCTVVQNDSFENCSAVIKRETCYQDEFCKRPLKVTNFKRQLYNDEISDQISRMLAGCCGPCGKIDITHTFAELAQLNKINFRSSDIIFPVIGKKSALQIYNFYFIPIYDVPSAYFFTKPVSDEESMGRLIRACFNTWPLIITCLLLAFIAGFIVWFLERKQNRGEFPKEFLFGLSEGFWWSFVSMTTVGYGDKTPKTTMARMFAVAWILVGITIFALLTGSLTNNINAINEYKEPTLYGKRVGGLQSRLNEATLVAHHGGSLVEYSYTDTTEGIVELIKAVNEKVIDGFIISRPTYYEFNERIKTSKQYQNIVERIPLDRCEKKYIGGDELAVGLLFWDFSAYKYFKNYFVDNWLQIKGCLEFRMNREAKHLSQDATQSHFKGDFHVVLYVMLALIGVIIIYGIFQMLFKRFEYRPCKPLKEEGNVEMS